MAKQYNKNNYQPSPIIKSYSEPTETTAPAPAHEKVPVVKTKQCPIRAIVNDLILIDFDGFGLSLPLSDKSNKIGDVVSVKYCGKIGTTTFKLM